jgi:hypothetical protein
VAVPFEAAHQHRLRLWLDHDRAHRVAGRCEQRLVVQRLPPHAGTFDPEIEIALIAVLAVLVEAECEDVLPRREIHVGHRAPRLTAVHEHRRPIEAQPRAGHRRPLHRRLRTDPVEVDDEAVAARRSGTVSEAVVRDGKLVRRLRRLRRESRRPVPVRTGVCVSIHAESIWSPVKARKRRSLSVATPVYALYWMLRTAIGP